MEKKERFDGVLARQYCMVYGTVVGVLTSLSFLCSMYGVSHASMGMMSNLLGLLALFVAGRKIKEHRLRIQYVSFGRACWMALFIYFYAILLTAVVQYIYFAFLDKGRLAMQIGEMLAMPAYRQMIEQIAGGEDVADKMIESALAVMQSPAEATMQLMWMNCIIALICLLPTALIGITGKKVKN